MNFIKKILIWVVLGGALYALIGYHYFYFGGSRIKILKKTKYTLVHTFNDFSSPMITNKKILSNDALYDAGVADLLIDIGRMSEKEYDKIMEQFAKEGR